MTQLGADIGVTTPDRLTLLPVSILVQIQEDVFHRRSRAKISANCFITLSTKTFERTL